MTSHRRDSRRESLVVATLLFMLLFATFVPHANANSPTKNPVQVNQTPTTRSIIIDWTKTASDQDRFYPDFIIVNQGDTIALTFINNDTVVHDIVIGPPYNILVNASVPGLYDDVTGQLITTPATRNSPGVQVSGTPGNVSATYSFVANYAGIFEYVCSYHVDVGMIGYLVVLAPNSPSITQPNVQNQPPTTRPNTVEWMETQAGQDRFYPDFIVVNQGDTVDLTFINNDTVAHDFVIGPPYSIDVNATVPGMYDDMTGELITTPATRNSPGVVVTGTPGNVSAKYSFVAKYPGIFQFVCTYHIDVGMFGYLVVLAPNSSSITQPNVPNQTVPQSSSLIQASIDAGSGVNVDLPGYTPTDITVVIGVNNTVKWTNNDNMAHTVTASDGSFDSGKMNPGATYLYTFTKPGVYHYVCTYHNWMHGTVTVVSETIGSESEEHGELTVVLTANEIYGIVGFGIVALLAIMLVLGRTKRDQQTPAA